jgi:hypothetical protein
MNKLHVWTNDTDTVVATSAVEARRIAADMVGETIEDYPGDEWYKYEDDHPLTINDDETGKTTKTCAQWITSDGRGFLCSTEY